MNILIVEDHPLVAQIYETTLVEYFSAANHVNIYKAYTCAEVYTIYKSSVLFDLIFVDYKLPPDPDSGLCCGIDVACLLKAVSSQAKIIFITAHYENVILYEIIKRVKPEALVTKNDLRIEDLTKIIDRVLTGFTYYSETVKQENSKIWSTIFIIDDHNRKIILLLNEGYKLKDLPSKVNLSQSAVQRRITSMKNALGTSEDSGLIRLLKDREYL